MEKKIKSNVDSKRKRGGQPGNLNAEKWTEKDAITLAQELIEWQKADAANVLWKDFLVIEKGLHKGIISDLCKKFPNSFANYIKRAKEIQSVKLCNSGLFNLTNPAVTIFLLKHFHKFTDKSQVEVEHVMPPVFIGLAVNPDGKPAESEDKG